MGPTSKHPRIFAITFPVEVECVEGYAANELPIRERTMFTLRVRAETLAEAMTVAEAKLGAAR